VHQSILTEFPDQNINVFVVWLPMYAVDTFEAVNEASAIYAGEKRVAQYWDPEKHLGISLAKSFGAVDQQVAWDVYLMFDPAVVWNDQPPSPTDWAHQLQDSAWANPAHLYLGNALFGRLREIMEAQNPE
jgi:hypothetical protein